MKVKEKAAKNDGIYKILDHNNTHNDIQNMVKTSTLKIYSRRRDTQSSPQKVPRYDVYRPQKIAKPNAKVPTNLCLVPEFRITSKKPLSPITDEEVTNNDCDPKSTKGEAAHQEKRKEIHKLATTNKLISNKLEKHSNSNSGHIYSMPKNYKSLTKEHLINENDSHKKRIASMKNIKNPDTILPTLVTNKFRSKIREEILDEIVDDYLRNKQGWLCHDIENKYSCLHLAKDKVVSKIKKKVTSKTSKRESLKTIKSSSSTLKPNKNVAKSSSRDKEKLNRPHINKKKNKNSTLSIPIKSRKGYQKYKKVLERKASPVRRNIKRTSLTKIKIKPKESAPRGLDYKKGNGEEDQNNDIMKQQKHSIPINCYTSSTKYRRDAAAKLPNKTGQVNKVISKNKFVKISKTRLYPNSSETNQDNFKKKPEKRDENKTVQLKNGEKKNKLFSRPRSTNSRENQKQLTKQKRQVKSAEQNKRHATLSYKERKKLKRYNAGNSLTKLPLKERISKYREIANKVRENLKSQNKSVKYENKKRLNTLTPLITVQDPVDDIDYYEVIDDLHDEIGEEISGIKKIEIKDVNNVTVYNKTINEKILEGKKRDCNDVKNSDKNGNTKETKSKNEGMKKCTTVTRYEKKLLKSNCCEKPRTAKLKDLANHINILAKKSLICYLPTKSTKKSVSNNFEFPSLRSGSQVDSTQFEHVAINLSGLRQQIKNLNLEAVYVDCANEIPASKKGKRLVKPKKNDDKSGTSKTKLTC